MIYKRFYINIIIRIAFLLATCFLIVLPFFSGKIFLIINHILFLAIQVYFLIKYVNRVNYDLSNFIEGCISRDFNMIKFPNGKGKSYTKLYKSLSTLSDALKKSEIETIFKSQYLYAAIQNVGTGLIWFEPDGEVILVNKSAKELLNLNTLSNINELESVSYGFSDLLKQIRPQENKLVKIHTHNTFKQISVKAAELIQQGKQIKLITLHDIKNELDEAELDSWQKLIRVLAHEIMNSIGPIITTTTAISRYYTGETGNIINKDDINESTINNTIKGLDIIKERGLGLKEFVSNYRQLTNVPRPIIKEIELNSFIEDIVLLFNEDLKNRNIDFKIELNDSLKILADKKLIAQVVINLIKNAIEAVFKQKSPLIELIIFKNDLGKVVIQINDNGEGISKEVIDKIYIPFFTTKDEGSGIGLSLSRQIMRLHKGTINVKSEKGCTQFQLIF